ncbi:GNAT family protein [Streptomyces sp. MST-110588]|uniref:GNAT family N-acetyltransferase n=1 Tax=Streptomyces sp. MST-110588 TaxID=2833628 RepID=UPI001F5DF60B|nr:GNAT family protein [Streptomyces sp. MST-110588]UNO42111.1 GNAT family N-acetyltransferase [Streptomyces sp. MST-110588]
MTVSLADRTVLARRGSIVLTEQLPADAERLASRPDSAFEVDKGLHSDPLPITTVIRHAAVLDSAAEELLGSVTWRAVTYGPVTSCLAWNIGIYLLPYARGRGAGSTAVGVLGEYLFATTGFCRLEYQTDIDNRAAQRTAERAGFQREGILRGAQLRGGRRRDLVSYSLLRSDP